MIDGLAEFLRSEPGRGPEENPWPTRVWIARFENFTSSRFDAQLLVLLLLGEGVSRYSGAIEFYHPSDEELAWALGSDEHRSGDTPRPGLRRPDYLLRGEVRSHDVVSLQQTSRWRVYSYRLSDLSGRVAWSSAFEGERSQERPRAYR